MRDKACSFSFGIRCTGLVLVMVVVFLMASLGLDF